MNQQQLSRRDRSERRGSEGAAAWVDRALDPVVGILILAGLFDGMAGNPIHALVLIGAALGLVMVAPRAGTAPAEAVAAARNSARPWWRFALPVAVAFGAVAGGFERYRWPMTFAIIVPGVTGIVIASRARWRRAPNQPVDRIGVSLWVAGLVGLGVFELINFVLQPNRLIGSESHPTLSTLFDEVILGHPAQSAALVIWLLVGWWLVER
jgi:hypothetical protein